MRFFLAAVLMSVSFLGACDMKVESHVPSHQAELKMPTSDYPKLLATLDSIAASFGLKRFGAGLKESEGLFAAYMADKRSLVALDLSDHKGPGKVTLRLYDDYFPDTAQRKKFIAEVATIVQRHGGKLVPNESTTQKPKP